MDNSDIEDEYPNLGQLLGAYLHQDFDLFGPTLDDVVKVFIGDSTEDEVLATRQEIARFLELKADHLDEELERLGSGYSREPGTRAREYLHWLDGLLVEGLANRACRA